MKLIKISTDLELTVHEFPSGNHAEQNEFLRSLIGSYLYETDKHGCPILGNVLFVGEEWGRDGIDFCGIEDSAFRLLELQLNNMISAMKATKEALGK